MELSSSGLHDRLSSFGRGDISPQKDKDEGATNKPTDASDPQELMVQRCVIIQRDEKGYGLTVSGDNPVFVQSVKEDGAAARAGVRQGDRIIKVNGTLVTQSNHQDVVELIKSGTYVALTLLGKPPGHGRSFSGTIQPLNLSGNNQNSHNVNVKSSSPSDRITGPQPVDPEKQQQLTNSRIHTIRKMLENEVIYLDKLRLDFSKTPSDKIRMEVNGAMKRVKTLEEQLHNLTGLSHDQIIPRSPKSPPSLGRHYHSEKENRSATSPVPGLYGRGLTHQISAPALPTKSERFPSLILNPTSECTESNVSFSLLHQQEEPKLELQSPSNVQKSTISSSLENINQLNSRSTTWPQGGPTHSRQSSSPEALMLVENLRHRKNEVSKSSPSDSLCRSHSEACQHSYSRKCHVSEPSHESETKKHQKHTNSSRGSSIGQYDSAIESPPPSPPATPPEYVDVQDLGESFEGEDGGLHEEYGTPPENSSPEINMQNVAAKLIQNPSIICMEDDDFSSDTEVNHLDSHGPFNGLWKLVRNPAHLAVFAHYLMSNSDPSSLFFYLITEMYEQGTLKEMKKWAYEVHSSFMVPGAPLKVKTVDETILHEIDDVLLNHIEKEEVLRGVFRKARKRAKDELNDLLAEFRNTRVMGLGNIFGPLDCQLEEAMSDKTKELKIIEQLLVPCLENLGDDIENISDTASAKAVALATVLRQFGVKSPKAVGLIDRCPTFVAKEKTRLRFLQRNKKVIFVHGHHFVPQHYYSVTYCNHCQLIIWGVGNQGYQCQNCEMNIHKLCVKIVEEHCIGALTKKDKKRDRMSGIMENFMGKTRKPSHPVPAAIEKAKKLNEEWNNDNSLNSINSSENSHETGERFNESKTERANATDETTYEHSLRLNQEDLEKSIINKKSTSIGRSESFRQRRESRPSFRKRSDPNIPRSKSDVEVDDKCIVSNLNNSGSSSNSSISNRSLDSPSNSSEMVHRTPIVNSTDTVPAGSTPATGVPSSHASTPSTQHHYDDSDLEAEADPPNWQDAVDWDVLRLMKPKEKKRQDVINELLHTERTHVRNLKVLDRLFYKPLQQEQLLPPDFLQLLFPNLEEMLEIHSSFNNKLKARRKEETTIGNIGQLMLEMFDGSAGEHLKKAAATYCQSQSVALESLKMRQKKDQKLAQFLSDAEVHNLCRRLQLKDIIASGFQRLTKYPLLLENIAKYTAPNTEEYLNLQKGIECSKDILVYVDSAVKEAENLHRLMDVQKKLDKSAFEKVDHPIVHSFKNLDVTKHRLIHEGPLMWRLNKQKNIDMHVVLFEDVLVLLQKQDDKYILKFHNTNLTTGREDTKIMHSPILRVHNLLIRNNATDKRSIFLISSSELHAMYEFVAATASEKKIWCKYLTEAVEVNKNHGGANNKPQEPTNTVADRSLPNEESVEDVEIGSKECGTQEDQEFQDPSASNDPAEPPISSQQISPSISTPATPPFDVSDNQQDDIVSKSSTSSDTPGGISHQKSQRRLQRIEVLHIADGPQLIEPCEVVVSQGAVFQTAEPVLTPIERLRRKDQQITLAIREKELLVADILQIPSEDFHHIANLAEEIEEEKGAQELVLAAIQQANQLTLQLNENLNVTEEDAVSASNVEAMPDDDSSFLPFPQLPNSSRRCNKFPGIQPDKLAEISSAMNRHLTQLLAVITEIEEERKQLRRELHSSREQIHLLHEAHRHCVVRSHSPSNYSVCHSRPSSFISVTSSLSEGVPEFNDNQQLFSVLEKTPEVCDCEDRDSDSSLIVESEECKLNADLDSCVNENLLSSNSKGIDPNSENRLVEGCHSCSSPGGLVTNIDSDLGVIDTEYFSATKDSEQYNSDSSDCVGKIMERSVISDEVVPLKLPSIAETGKLPSASETDNEEKLNSVYI